MQEIGFWDYSCPGNGSLERYTERDWDMLLDDMVEGGFNSLVLCMKWLTTGYRSRLPWLDQDMNCSAISSENAVLYHALRGARARGLKVWTLVVATIFTREPFHLPGGVKGWGPDCQVFDLDCPGLPERIDALFTEIVTLFGAELDGLIAELEFCDGDAPHRIPIYDAWAQANGRPDYATIKNIRLEPRAYPFRHWRDFTTERRIDTLHRIERTIRDAGFTGALSSLIEIDNQPMAAMGNMNLERLQQALPHWAVVTYDSIYDRRRNRLATMDFCIEQPRLRGLDVQYLTRGVMTFDTPPDLPPTTLEEQWRMALEDVRAHKPETLWFMGSDARLDGPVCSDVKLPQWGFADGRTARRRLMEMAADMLA